MEGWLLGILDNEGFAEGCLLGQDDGCDVGQSKDEGCLEDWLLGAVLLDGDLEGIDDGEIVADGASLGIDVRALVLHASNYNATQRWALPGCRRSFHSSAAGVKLLIRSRGCQCRVRQKVRHYGGSDNAVTWREPK